MTRRRGDVSVETAAAPLARSGRGLALGGRRAGAIERVALPSARSIARHDELSTERCGQFDGRAGKLAAVVVEEKNLRAIPVAEAGQHRIARVVPRRGGLGRDRIGERLHPLAGCASNERVPADAALSHDEAETEGAEQREVEQQPERDLEREGKLQAHGRKTTHGAGENPDHLPGVNKIPTRAHRALTLPW